MISRLVAAAMVFALPAALSGDDAFRAPDTLVLKGGRTVRGLIVKNSADSVTLQEEFQETTYPKSGIVRIRDEADIGVLFTDIHRHGDLPSWRVIANDLRMHDEITSFEEIPATAITVGEFRNVPYKSFRVNRNIELNIYGDPNDPCGLELGIYGVRKHSARLQGVLRAYLAGFLTSRKELAALYSLNFKKSKAQAGEMTFEVTPPDAEDAFNAWWLSIYNLKDLDAIRLSDREYAKLTLPADQVINRRGGVISNAWTPEDLDLSWRLDTAAGQAPVLSRGFYRDKSGAFRLLESVMP